MEGSREPQHFVFRMFPDWLLCEVLGREGWEVNRISVEKTECESVSLGFFCFLIFPGTFTHFIGQ